MLPFRSGTLVSTIWLNTAENKCRRPRTKVQRKQQVPETKGNIPYSGVHKGGCSKGGLAIRHVFNLYIERTEPNVLHLHKGNT